MILVAAYNRWWGEGLYQLFGDGFWGMIFHNFAGPNMLMAVAITYDAFSRGRLHWVHSTMIPAILLAAGHIMYLPSTGVAADLPEFDWHLKPLICLSANVCKVVVLGWTRSAGMLGSEPKVALRLTRCRYWLQAI
jgi:hypothetical protein